MRNSLCEFAILNKPRSKSRYAGLDKLYVSGLIGIVSSNLIIGDIVGAFLVILPTIAIYIGGALLINILVFSRKELDF